MLILNVSTIKHHHACKDQTSGMRVAHCVIAFLCKGRMRQVKDRQRKLHASYVRKRTHPMWSMHIERVYYFR